MRFEIEKLAEGGFVVFEGAKLLNGEYRRPLYACLNVEDALIFVRRKFFEDEVEAVRAKNAAADFDRTSRGAC